MNIKAVTEEIHAKLNKLGLSYDPRFAGTLNMLEIRKMSQPTNYCFVSKHISWEIDYTSKRFMLFGWLIFGGKLRGNK